VEVYSYNLNAQYDNAVTSPVEVYSYNLHAQYDNAVTSLQ